VKDDCLVTSKTVIEEAGEVCIEYRAWKEYILILTEVRLHLELYFDKIKSVPPWGTHRYRELLEEGFTPRILHGPNKRGRLRPNQKRKIILDENREIVYGPLLN
jgi:hypothetical protein